MESKTISPLTGSLVLGLALVLSTVTYLKPPMLFPKPVAAVAKQETGHGTGHRMSVVQVALVTHLSSKYKQPRPLVERIVHTSYREALKHGMAPNLVLALVMKESSLNPRAASAYGAIGLMQVVPRYHMEKLSSKADPIAALSRPEENIRVGTSILAEYMKLKRGVLSAALVKYSGKAKNYERIVASYQQELDVVSRNATIKAS